MTLQQFDFHIHLVCDHPGKWPDPLNSVYQFSIGSPYQITSGSDMAEPSQADLRLTQRLKEALALIDVRALDHVIIGDGAWVSLAERGLL